MGPMSYPEGPLETAFVFDKEGRTLYWHLPEGRSAGGLPDDDALWDVLVRHSHKLGDGRLAGVVHTHPWFGKTGYSQTDVETFAAVEAGLGQRLVWPIATFDHLHFFAWAGPGRYDYVEVLSSIKLGDLAELRFLSGSPPAKKPL